MKKIVLFFALICTFTAYSQTPLMRIHKKGGTTQDYPITDVDSVTYVLPANNQSIADIVSTNPSFSILKAAVTKAGLVGALSGGTLTVFAPDNDAFAASNLTETVINGLPVQTLDSILKYHVLTARVASAGVPASDTVKSLLGTNIYASKNTNGVFVNGISVKQADVQATNGVIHVISKVLTPPTKTIAQLVSEDPELSLLLAAVGRAGLTSKVSGPGKYTAFAPTNAAFNELGIPNSAAISFILEATVVTVANSHILGTNVFSSDLINGKEEQTLQLEPGVVLVLGQTPPSVKIKNSVNASNIILNGANIIATNGVIHKIDRVLR